MFNILDIFLFVDDSKAFDSIPSGKVEQILLACGLRKETVTALMMLYKNMKGMVRLPDGDTDLFNTASEVFQGDT